MSVAEQLLSNLDIDIVQERPKDVLEQADALPFWSQEYTQLDKGPFTGSVTSVSCDEVQIFRESMNRSVDELASAPADHYVIGLPTIIEGDASWGGGALDKSSLITLDKNAELLFRTSHLSEISCFVIPAKRLEQYAADVEGVHLSKVMNNVHPVEPLPPHIVKRMLATLFIGTEHISQLGDDVDVRQIWRHFEDSLLDASLQALLHAYDTTSRYCEHRVHRHIVSCVRDLTLSHQFDALTIGELCTMLHVSRRTLNHAFKQVLGVSPVVYMRNVRLHKVRAELLASPHEIMSIANVASRWGFWHMSLFARYYRELFGECPSETLENSRALDRFHR